MVKGFYYGASTISPHRKPHGDLTATRMKTNELAQDVLDAVEEDLTLHYRVTETSEFLNRLLPVGKKMLDAILLHMIGEKLYDTHTRRWRGFPEHTRESRKEKKPKENALYGPFCEIAEAIRKFVESRTSSQMGATQWIDYHSKSPKTPYSNAAQLRPDALFALQAVAEQTVLKEAQVRTPFCLG